MLKYNTTWKFAITGTFSNDIEEKINFDIPLTYPNVEIQFELNEVSGNALTTITCKSLSTILWIENVVIEKKWLKKNKGLFLIERKSFSLYGKKSFDNYDSKRRQF